jgi:hypothetical protein
MPGIVKKEGCLDYYFNAEEDFELITDKKEKKEEEINETKSSLPLSPIEAFIEKTIKKEVSSILTNKKTSLLVNKIRQRSGYHDEGDEIVVQEYLAGSKKHFLQHGNERKKQIGVNLKIPLIIHTCYNCSESAIEMEIIAKNIVNIIYQNKIRFTKLIFYMGSKRTYGNNDSHIFIEANYTDFNAVARLIHPSAFRRLSFRLKEMHKNLEWGYGSSHSEKSSIEQGIFLPDFKGLTEKEIEEKFLKIVQDYVKK